MRNYYPSEPYTHPLPKGLHKGECLAIGFLWGFTSLIPMIFGVSVMQIPTAENYGTVVGMITSIAVSIWIIASSVLMFKHLPRRFKQKRQNNKAIASWKETCAKIDLANERETSLEFTKTLRNK